MPRVHQFFGKTLHCAGWRLSILSWTAQLRLGKWMVIRSGSLRESFRSPSTTRKKSAPECSLLRLALMHR